MNERKLGRVFHLKLEPPTQWDLFSTPQSHIREYLSPGSRTTRYGRDWIIGQTEEADGVLSGRIGFQGENGQAEIWDDAKRDFIPTAIPRGLTAPFAVDLNTFDAVLQARGQAMQIGPMTGALEALLNVFGGRWHIVGQRKSLSLKAWKQSVEIVTAVKLRIREPNPHYHGAKNLEALMKDFESEVVRLEARSDKGLNLESEFLLETEGHLERGYGEGEYTGYKKVDGDLVETSYSTRVGAEEVADEVDVDQLTGEVPSDQMMELLSRGKEGRRLEGRSDDSSDSG